MNTHQLIACTAFCMAVGGSAFAQTAPLVAAATPDSQSDKSTAARPQASTAASPVTLSAAATRGAGNPALRTITAAGSVIVLADGIVANASMAQIPPPAPGFVYER